MNSFLGANVTDGPVAAVLKCMNQGLVAPAIMALRISLMGKVTYKDCGPNWDVEVRTNTASVIVIHQKVCLSSIAPSTHALFRFQAPVNFFYL